MISCHYQKDPEFPLHNESWVKGVSNTEDILENSVCWASFTHEQAVTATQPASSITQKLIALGDEIWVNAPSKQKWTNKHRKRCSSSPVIRGKLIKATANYPFVSTRKPWSERRTSVGEHVEKLGWNLPVLLERGRMEQPPCGKVWQLLRLSNMELPSSPEILLLAVHPRKAHTPICTNTHTHTHSSQMSTVHDTKEWNVPNIHL